MQNSKLNYDIDLAGRNKYEKQLMDKINSITQKHKLTYKISEDINNEPCYCARRSTNNDQRLKNFAQIYKNTVRSLQTKTIIKAKICTGKFI
jgi:hypothetical protein